MDDYYNDCPLVGGYERSHLSLAKFPSAPHAPEAIAIQRQRLQFAALFQRVALNALNLIVGQLEHVQIGARVQTAQMRDAIHVERETVELGG